MQKLLHQYEEDILIKTSRAASIAVRNYTYVRTSTVKQREISEIPEVVQEKTINIEAVEEESSHKMSLNMSLINSIPEEESKVDT